MITKKALQDSESRKELIETIDIKSLNDIEKTIITSFLDDCIRKRKAVEDLFELSSIVGYVTENHLILAKEMLYKRVSYYLKLTILDYLLDSFEKINHQMYKDLNEKASADNNKLVSFQGKLNLTCLEKSQASYFAQSDHFPTSIFYYRFLNSLFVSKVLATQLRDFMDAVQENISNSEINSEQKKELIQMIKEL